MTMRLFAQITKVDQAKRLVFGRACQEVVDRSGEIFDYEASKPYFKAWSDNIAKDTDGKSFGNVRAMHGKVSAGKIAEPIAFNDAEKAVDIAVKVVDDNEWNKTLEGCYTGFSIGGSYIGEKKAEKLADGTEAKRYVADPNEISLVDQPCVPTAKFFDIVKADGVVEKVAFKTPELEVTGTDDEVAEFAKALNEGGLSMADAIALVKAGKPAADAVDKGMWNVQDFASVLASIASVAASAQSDAEWEKDGSPVPEKLRSWLGDGVAIFKAMAKEEADELLASLKTAGGGAAGAVMAMAHATRGDDALRKRAPYALMDMVAGIVTADAALAKAADNADALAKKADYVQKMHGMLSEMGAKCMDKAAPVGDLAKVQADLTAALADIAALKKQPVPYVTLRAVARSEAEKQTVDVSKITIESLEPADFLKNADGSIDYTTSLHVKREKALAAAGNS